MYGWIQAIDEAMVTHHLGVADEYDSYEAARRKLNELIDWHIAVATDPRVNGGWQLVPVEPDSNMSAFGGEAVRIDTTTLNKLWTATKVWRAMLAAAPKRGDAPTASTTTTTP